MIARRAKMSWAKNNSEQAAKGETPAMVALLKIVDEHFGASKQERQQGVELKLASERVTAREILRQRVEAEVDEINQRKRLAADGHMRTRSFLIDLDAASPESVLNTLTPSRKVKMIDVDHEIARAVSAFENRQFIMLLDDRQIDELDAWVTLMPESEVLFLYLSPLKGG